MVDMQMRFCESTKEKMICLVMEKFIRLKILLESAEVNADKFYNANNIAAGNRLRKQMQDLRNLAQAVSFEVGNLMSALHI